MSAVHMILGSKCLFKNNLRFCDRSTRESPFETESYSLTSAKEAPSDQMTNSLSAFNVLLSCEP
jgi:hypothetical protein